MENKIITINNCGTIYQYTLKYVGYGECILHGVDDNNKAKSEIYKSYEITGIYKEYGSKNQYYVIVQAKKDFRHRVSVGFYNLN